MRLLLGSGGLSTPARREAWSRELGDFLGPVSRVLFIPYALADHDVYLEMIVSRGFHAGRTLDGIHRAPSAVRAVGAAEAIYVGGGNTFRLLDALERLALLAPIRRRVAAGMPFIGISAGTNVACPTIRTTNDMPIVWPRSAAALDLVPFQINPHYVDGAFHLKHGGRYLPYGGETRDVRLTEFHEMNDVPILALREGSILRVEGRRARVTGAAGARLFRRGRKPADLAIGADVSRLLRRI
jgi:dipeptidase E